ncbi:MAG: ECF-type sigma factor, partial [Pseudomonadota bacterium]|nr:ECF-type sigma factor [Pseudomonadota bacterium]
INRMLSELTALDERQGRVAELRLFGELSSAQIAELLSVSIATVDRDWASARLWLAREMGRGVAR